MFGMESNPASLKAREQAFREWFSQGNHEFEVVGHVVNRSHVDQLVYADMELIATALPNRAVRLTFDSCVVPYSTARVTVCGDECKPFVQEFTSGGLYNLVAIKVIG